MVADPLIGTVIGRYELMRLLGEGGMGQVYLGTQPAIGSLVAVKVLSAECARSPELLDRFFAEARAVNVIRHESIVSVLDMAVLPDGRPYIIMEYIEGRTLGALVSRGDAPIGGVVQVMGEVLSALAAAHERGIVHRDLKPDNILITAEGHAKVVDFGIAKLAPELSASPLTRTGALLGTPAYMAPEQISGAGNVDGRADLYAAGVVLFEAVTGRPPFHGATLYDLMRAHLETAPPSPRALRADVPEAIEQVILMALAKDPANRFQSAAAMAGALHGAARALPPEQRRLLSVRDSNAMLAHPAPRTDRSTDPAGATGPTVRATAATTSPDATRRGRRGLAIALIAVAVSALVVALLVLRAPERAPTAAAAGPADAPALDDAGAIEPPIDAAVAIASPTDAAVAIEPPRTSPRPRAAPDAAIAAPTPTPTPPPATTPASRQLVRPVDYDPRAFDAMAYLPRALGLAQQLYPDAKLVRFDIHGVRPTGLANLGLVDLDSSYLFRSPAHSARPPDVPRNLDVEIACYVEVTVGTKQVEARVRDYGLDKNCRWALRPFPRCTFAQVWAIAKSKGAALDTVAKVAFLEDGMWWFDNQDSSGTGLAESYADRCSN